MGSEIARPFKLKSGEIIQFFSAKKDGKTVAVFPVDHSKYPSATAYLSKTKDTVLDGIAWDYLTSASVEDIKEQFPDFWNTSNKENVLGQTA